MHKIIEFPYYGQSGRSNIDVIHPGEIEKIASSEYDEEIQKKVRSITPSKDYLWVLVNALGSNPPWPQNVNGDIFPEKGLLGVQSAKEALKNPDGKQKIRYKTFEDGHVFAHHANKDPEKSFGTIELSVWNPRMKRVELVLCLDRRKNPDICRKIEDGKEEVWLSMGCKVAKDQCSYCGHWASHRAPKYEGDPDAYCEHLRFRMGEVLPDGRQIGAINWHPRFFDISFVLVPADKTAGLLMKIASSGGNVSSVEKTHNSDDGIEKTSSTKTGEVKKKAEIKKKFTGGPVLTKEYQKIRDKILPLINKVSTEENEIPDRVIDRISESFPVDNIFSTMGLMGIIPKPSEFQRIILIRLGNKPLADELRSSNRIIPVGRTFRPGRDYEDIFNISDRNFDPRVFESLKDFIPGRSCFGPHLYNRLINYSPRPVSRPEEISSLVSLGMAYTALRYLIPKNILPNIRKFIMDNPDKAAILAGITLGESSGLQKIFKNSLDIFNETPYHKYAADRSLSEWVGIPTTIYAISGHSDTEDLSRKRLDQWEKIACKNREIVRSGGAFVPADLAKKIFL